MSNLFVAGCGHDGRLGTGNEKNQHKFVELKQFASDLLSNTDETNTQHAVKAVVVGGFHNFIITENDDVFACGLNEFGQLGIDSKAQSVKTPMIVPFFQRRKDSGRYSATGAGNSATNSNRNQQQHQQQRHHYSPANLLAPSIGLIDLAAGAYHTVAWCVDGIYVCGNNEHGQLGSGDNDHRFSLVSILPNVGRSGGGSGGNACEAQNSVCGGGGECAPPAPHHHRFSNHHNQQQTLASAVSNFAEQIHAISCGSFHTVIVVKAPLPLSSSAASGSTSSDSAKSAALIINGRRDALALSAGDRKMCAQRFRSQRQQDEALMLEAVTANMLAGDGESDGNKSAEEEGAGIATATSTSPHDQLRDLIDKALKLQKEEEDEERALLLQTDAAPISTVLGDSSSSSFCHFVLFTCGKGDFGELGYDGDEWDKLASMEKRLKQHISNKAAFMAQGGRGEDFGDFVVGGSSKQQTKAVVTSSPPPITTTNASPFMKVKAPKVTAKPKKTVVVRRPEFSSNTFKRVLIPLLDLLLLTSLSPSSPKAADDDDDALVVVGIRNVAVQAMHHHTAVTVTYASVPPKTTTTPDLSSNLLEERTAVYHFGCLFTNQIETVETSIPMLAENPSAPPLPTSSAAVPVSPSSTRVKMIHAGDEIFFTVVEAEAVRGEGGEKESASDVIFVIGKGNLGFSDDDDFVTNHRRPPSASVADGDKGKLAGESARRLELPPPQSSAEDEARRFTHYTVISIVGKTHFFITSRWWLGGQEEAPESKKDTNNFVDVCYVFGDNFMGQCALNTEENAILQPTIVTLPGSNGSSGVKHSFSIAVGYRHSILLRKSRN